MLLLGGLCYKWLKQCPYYDFDYNDDDDDDDDD